jgi:hypothetical protein
MALPWPVNFDDLRMAESTAGSHGTKSQNGLPFPIQHGDRLHRDRGNQILLPLEYNGHVTYVAAIVLTEWRNGGVFIFRSAGVKE